MPSTQSILNNFSGRFAPFMLFVAPLLVYLIGRTLLRGLPESMGRPIVRAGVMAFFLLLFSIAGVFANHVEYALHLPLAVATVAMTLGLGVLLLARHEDSPRHHARRWPLIFPAILVVMVCALAGEIDIIFALSLALVGVVSIYAIEERSAPVSMVMPVPPRDTGDRLRTILLLVPSTIGILIAAILAPEAIERTGAILKPGSELLASSWLIAPAMVVPLLVESLPATRKHTLDDDAGAIIRLPLLAIGFVLPLTWLVHFINSSINSSMIKNEVSSTVPTTGAFFTSTQFNLPSLDMPSVVLRVDGLILCAATILIMPGALGVFRLGKVEGFCLIVMFLAYLFLSRMAGA